MSDRRIRIFISSPGDLGEERATCEGVIRRLGERLRGSGSASTPGGLAELVPLRYESPGAAPAVAGEEPQATVDYYLAKAGETDIVVCLFWSRIGTPVTVGDRRYPSGSVYEFEHAYTSYLINEKPTVLLYRKTAPPPAGADAGQVAGVDRLFRGVGGTDSHYMGLYGTFATADELATRLEADLTTLLTRVASGGGERRRSGYRADLIKSVRRYLDRFHETGDNLDRVSAELPFSSTLTARLRLAGEATEQTCQLTGLAEAFRRAHGKVLLLGEPGCGKTYQLISLMSTLLLLARERYEQNWPVPILLNLSSYFDPRAGAAGASGMGLNRFMQSGGPSAEPFDEWVVGELVLKYSVPRKYARRLVYGRELVYCLDGLDEILLRDAAGQIDEEASRRRREECVQGLHRVLHANPEMQAVLCCRSQTFEAVRCDVPDLATVELLALSPDDVWRFLEDRAGCDGLLLAARRDARLLEILRTPLFLRFMCIGLKGMTDEQVLDLARRPDWERQLYSHYVRSATHRLGDNADYTKQDILNYLQFLSKWPESVFLVESLQPSMLDRRGRRLYDVLANSALSAYLAAVTVVPCAAAIAAEWLLLEGSGMGAMRALITLLLLGLLVVFPTTVLGFASRTWWFFGATFAVAFTALRCAVVWASAPSGVGGGDLHEVLMGAAVTLPFTAIVFGLLGAYLFPDRRDGRLGFFSAPDHDITPLEMWNWQVLDPARPWRGGWNGLLLGPIIGLSFHAAFGPARGWSFGLIATALVAFFAGLAASGIPTRLQPNQGIVRSLRNALLFGGILTPLAVLSCLVSYGLTYGFAHGLINGALAFVVLFASLIFGGIPVLKHVVLGRLLARRNATPTWNDRVPWRPYIRFLDDMVRIRLLRRQGGGYSFRHITLKKFFLESGDRSLPG